MSISLRPRYVGRPKAYFGRLDETTAGHRNQGKGPQPCAAFFTLPVPANRQGEQISDRQNREMRHQVELFQRNDAVEYSGSPERSGIKMVSRPATL
uniref:Uncharacterized protein n=1 Tax=Paracoccus marcusii TaxID=59779 RepID=I6VE11_9RHOB|nr:hypothetical protein [Paracoccus marcusii]